MDLITFPAAVGTLPTSVLASWSIFHPDKPGQLFVLEPEEASCIDILEPVSHYHIAICQGDKLQCQGWVNRHYQLPPENFFKLETDGKASCFHLRSRRLIIIWMRVPSREDASCVFGLLAHEALHAAYAIMDGMGMDPDFTQRLIDRTTGFMQTLQQQALELNHLRRELQSEKEILHGLVNTFEAPQEGEWVPSHLLTTALRQRDSAKIEIDQLKNELRDYAVLALYEHAHITESEACRLTRLDPVSFRLLRENAFKTMCRLLELPETPAPLPQP